MNIFPGRIIDSVNGLVGKVKLLLLSSVTFDVANPYIMLFKDQDGGTITSKELNIENIKNLSDSLNNASSNHKVRVIEIPAQDLDSEDSEGVHAYLDLVGFTLNGSETVLVKIMYGVPSSFPNGDYDDATIAYMDAIQMPNDTTLYYVDSPYERSGTQMWNAIDQLILQLKADGLFSQLTALRPRLGTTADHFGRNLMDPTRTTATYYGSWIHDGSGSVGNGANTYMSDVYPPGTSNDGGITTVVNKFNFIPNQIQVSMGSFQGGYDSNMMIGESTSSATDQGGFVSVRDGYIAYPLPRLGVKSVLKNGDNLIFIKNGIVEATGFGGFSSGASVFEGAYNHNGSAIYVMDGTLCTTAIHATMPQADVVKLHNALITFEEQLKRKTW